MVVRKIRNRLFEHDGIRNSYQTSALLIIVIVTALLFGIFGTYLSHLSNQEIQNDKNRAIRHLEAFQMRLQSFLGEQQMFTTLITTIVSEIPTEQQDRLLSSIRAYLDQLYVSYPSVLFAAHLADMKIIDTARFGDIVGEPTTIKTDVLDSLAGLAPLEQEWIIGNLLEMDESHIGLIHIINIEAREGRNFLIIYYDLRLLQNSKSLVISPTLSARESTWMHRIV